MRTCRTSPPPRAPIRRSLPLAKQPRDTGSYSLVFVTFRLCDVTAYLFQQHCEQRPSRHFIHSAILFDSNRLPLVHLPKILS